MIALVVALLQDPAAFRYDAGQELRWRQKGEAVVAKRTLFDGRDGTLMHVVSECDLKLKVLKREGTNLELEAAPVAYRVEFKDRGRVLELKDGAFTDTQEKDKAEGLTAPFTMSATDAGRRMKLGVTRPSDQMIAMFAMDVLPSPAGSLLGWFGSVPADAKPGREWKSMFGFMLAREDFVFLEATAALSREAGKERLGKATFRVDEKRTKYPWVAGVQGEGGGTLEFDAKGNARSAKVNWSAKSADGAPLVTYKSEITIEPVP